MRKNILITGGAGFVGSNLAIFLKQNLGNVNIICFDNLMRRGSELNKVRLSERNIKFVRGDIRNKKLLLKLPKIDILIECSAEPSVLASYKDPDYNIQTNLIGTLHCLELARRDRADFIFLSTSRVYPVQAVNDIPYKEYKTRFDWKNNVLGAGFSHRGINEEFDLNGIKSLYGATKLSSEQIIVEYMDMFGIRGVINRFGVIAGPWQMGKVDQGIVGFWVVQHKFKKKMSYIGFGGQGKQVRDVVHVDDVCQLILKQVRSLGRLNRSIYNVGGGRDNSISLQELTSIVQKVTRQKINIPRVQTNRRSDVRIYISDNKRVSEDFQWIPQKDVEEIVFDVNAWIDKHVNVLNKVLND